MFNNGEKMRSEKLFRVYDFMIIAFLIILNPFISCTKVNTTFYDKVLNDFDSSSYFVALDIKSPSYKGRAIIENNNLYHFLNKTEGLNEAKYRFLMKRILGHHKVLKTSEKYIENWHFIKVQDEESVIRTANQGKNNFIAFYFNGVVLKYGIKQSEQDAIINQLFYWYVPAKIDKVSGYLIIG
jgi:hypothetical protein